MPSPPRKWHIISPADKTDRRFPENGMVYGLHHIRDEIEQKESRFFVNVEMGETYVDGKEQTLRCAHKRSAEAKRKNQTPVFGMVQSSRMSK